MEKIEASIEASIFPKLSYLQKVSNGLLLMQVLGQFHTQAK
jgi:hypothetical protein